MGVRTFPVNAVCILYVELVERHVLGLNANCQTVNEEGRVRGCY